MADDLADRRAFDAGGRRARVLQGGETYPRYLSQAVHGGAFSSPRAPVTDAEGHKLATKRSSISDNQGVSPSELTPLARARANWKKRLVVPTKVVQRRQNGPCVLVVGDQNRADAPG
jgi:hypothetical protein